jgi:hypothetical protein
MSEEWKSQRAEASMREGTEAIRKAAEEKANQEELLKWEEIKKVLTLGNENHKESIDLVIELLKEKFELPERKI